MTSPTEVQPPPPTHRFGRTRLSAAGRFFAGYAWIIIKNIIGWVFILISPALGFTLPGPGGIPLFLIGFALVTFPGKRKLTARVLRGRTMDLNQMRFDVIEIVAAILIPMILAWPAVKWLWRHIKPHSLETAWYIATALVAVSIVWILVRLAVRGMNLLIRIMPRLRRKIRPWLRRKGILLLPPRYRRRPLRDTTEGEVNDGILQIHERHRQRAKTAWDQFKPWLRRGIGLLISIWIFIIMVPPTARAWPVVKHDIASMNWRRFAVASVMFAVFLFLFRHFLAAGAQGVWVQAPGLDRRANLVDFRDGPLPSRRDLAGCWPGVSGSTVRRESDHQLDLTNPRAVHVPLCQRADRRFMPALVCGKDQPRSDHTPRRHHRDVPRTGAGDSAASEDLLRDRQSRAGPDRQAADRAAAARMEADQITGVHERRPGLAESGGLSDRPAGAAFENRLVVDDRGGVLPGVDSRLPCLLGQPGSPCANGCSPMF